MKRIRRCTTRTRSGCVTCKQRRKKCDERRPFCGNCTLSKRICRGYSDPFRNKNEVAEARFDHASQCLPLRELRLASETDDHRIASFHDLSGAIFSRSDQDLIHEILRRNASQYTIRHASLALSVQLEAFARNHRMRCVDQAEDVLSLWHHGQSLKGIQNLLQADMAIEQQIETLFALLLVISNEILRGNGPAALTHLEGALCILSASMATLSAKNRDVLTLEAIRTLYVRLEIHTLSFVGSRVPILSASSFRLVHERAGCNHSRTALLENRTFESVRTKFLGLKFRALQALRNQAGEDHANYICVRSSKAKQQRARSVVLADLQHWLQLFQPFLETAVHLTRATNSFPSQTPRECRLLHMQYLILVMRISAFRPEPQEMAFDTFESSFDAIIKHAEILVSGDQSHLFTLETGLIEPLYFTVLKCREPKKRVLALELLSSCRQEAAWDGPLMTAIARHVIYMEAVLIEVARPERTMGKAGDSVLNVATAVWRFRADPEAETYRISSTALLSIDWGRRTALVEVCHAWGKNRAICEALVGAHTNSIPV